MSWLKQLGRLQNARGGGRRSCARRPRWTPQLERLERRTLLSVVLQGDFATGPNPFAVALADFNGDGKIDLAVANSGTSTVSVLLGNGTGTFGAKTDFTTGSGPRSVAAADLNGDGKLDLVLADS